ncbi:MAG: DUF503 domain-containing protein [Planctomycetota bacterium]
MHIFAGCFHLSIPGAASLKDRRHAVKGLCERIRSRFPVAIADLAGERPLWGRADLGVTMVTADESFGREVLGKVRDFIAGAPDSWLDSYEVRSQPFEEWGEEEEI